MGVSGQQPLSITVASTLLPADRCSDYPEDAIATFEDADLESHVRNQMGLGDDDDLTCGLLATLTNLNADAEPLKNPDDPVITSLVGAQNLTSLATLNLFANAIADLSPLAGLTTLTGLGLRRNEISDLSPLGGLVSLSTANLHENLITDVGPLGSLPNLSVVALQGNVDLVDIRPLLDNPGVGAGDFVDLGLTDVSCADAIALEAKGVSVAHDCPVIVTESLPSGVVDVSYHETLTATGAAGVYSWSLASGSLPAGLSLSASGQITGTPTVVGFSPFAVAVTSDGRTAQRALSIRVDGDVPVLLPTEFCGDFPEYAIGTFADGQLESQVRDALGIDGEDSLTCEVLSTLVTLGGTLIESLDGIQNLTSLEQFIISEHAVTDIGPLAGLTSLKLLNFWTGDFDLAPLQGLTNLEHLSLDHVFPPADDFTALSSLTNLQELSLESAPITDLSPIGVLMNLTRLFLHEAPLNDLGPLAGLVNLAELGLHSNYLLSEIQPLLDNPGLGEGDHVTLWDTSVPCPRITALEAKGVSVDHTCLGVTTGSLPPGRVDVAYAQTLTSTLDPASVTWALAGGSGALPPGLGLSSNGEISGTPTTEGTWGFTVEVTDEADRTAQQILSITVVGVLSGGVPVSGLSGAEDKARYYVFTVPATAPQLDVMIGGGTGDANLYVREGALPTTSEYDCRPFLLGNDETCSIANPASGEWFVLVHAFEAYSDVTLAAEVTIPPVVLATSYLVGGYPDAPYSDAIAPATGGDGSYAYSVTDGSLPSGLSLDPNTGAITGTSTATGMSFFVITATSAGRSASTLYSITISTQPASAFNLWGVSVADGLPSSALQAQIDAALANWETVVTSNPGDLTLTGLSSTSCDGHGAFLEGGFVDDVVVLMNLAPDDGLGGTLGFASPCLVLSTAPYTVAGLLSLDTDDLSLMSSTELFTLVWHEIGHVMGIGSFWGVLGLRGGTVGEPTFLGVQANLEYVDLHGTESLIPVEESGGGGTALVHWDEGHFGNEIMTGFADDPAPISRMTIASLVDVGWFVTFASADAYELPACGATFSCLRATVESVRPEAVEVAPPFEPVVLPISR